MIKLTAISYNNLATNEPLSAVFGPNGGTLGRGTDNHFILPDPRNLVSRRQASIKSDGLRHTITNLSQASPIVLNGKEIEFEREYDFNAGDEIQIGLYVLRAEPHLVAVDGRLDSHPVASPAPVVEVSAMPTASPETSPNSISPPIPVHAAPNLAELHQKKSEADALSAAQSAESAPLASENDQALADGRERPVLPVGESEPLMQAFLRGAGIPQANFHSGLSTEFMEMLGGLVSTSVKGTFQLLATRTSIKREVKADLTIVVVRNNNPLKFLSDSETVLMQMLRKKMPGFMGPAEALQDAYTDLQAHQSGMIAGMNGAISEVLKRFDPKSLEKHIRRSTLLDSILPLRRKAQMWDKYDLTFDEINREAQHDYQKLFGKAFLKAYEKEITRNRNEKQDG